MIGCLCQLHVSLFSRRNRSSFRNVIENVSLLSVAQVHEEWTYRRCCYMLLQEWFITYSADGCRSILMKTRRIVDLQIQEFCCQVHGQHLQTIFNDVENMLNIVKIIPGTWNVLVLISISAKNRNSSNLHWILNIYSVSNESLFKEICSWKMETVPFLGIKYWTSEKCHVFSTKSLNWKLLSLFYTTVTLYHLYSHSIPKFPHWLEKATTSVERSWDFNSLRSVPL